MWEKKQKRKWYLFFIFPENWRFFVLFLRSVNIDRLRESYKYALAQSLHSPSQFYAEIWFGLLCFEILMKKTGTVLVFSVVLNISWWHKRVDMSACIFSFRAIYLQFGDEITPNMVANLGEILFQLDFSCKERKVQRWTNSSEACKDWLITPMLSLRQNCLKQELPWWRQCLCNPTIKTVWDSIRKFDVPQTFFAFCGINFCFCSTMFFLL